MVRLNLPLMRQVCSLYGLCYFLFSSSDIIDGDTAASVRISRKDLRRVSTDELSVRKSVVSQADSHVVGKKNIKKTSLSSHTISFVSCVCVLYALKESGVCVGCCDFCLICDVSGVIVVFHQVCSQLQCIVLCFCVV